MSDHAVVLLLLCLLTSAAMAEEARTIVHDGVRMVLSRSGDAGLEISYGADVPPSLRELGVTEGTLLVRGQWEDGMLVGEAYAFSPECKSIAYPIRGIVDRADMLVVVGPVPTSCKRDEYSWDKAVLKFTPPSAPAVKLTRAEKPRAKPKLESKSKFKPKPKPRTAPRQPSYPQPQPSWPYQQWRW